MNKRWSIFFIVVLLIAAWGFWRGMDGMNTAIYSSDSLEDISDRTSEEIVINDNVDVESSVDDNAGEEGIESAILDFDNRSSNNDSWNGEIKTFALTGEDFKFVMNEKENPDIKVDEGDKVRIEFTSTAGFHDWVVDEFEAATEKVWAVNSTFVEFIADKKGKFEYYCSVGQHRANGMKGNLIVE